MIGEYLYQRSQPIKILTPHNRIVETKLAWDASEAAIFHAIERFAREREARLRAIEAGY